MSRPEDDSAAADLPEDPRLVVLLRRSAWVALLGELGQRPYAAVSEMVDEVVAQLRAQSSVGEPAAENLAAAERSH